MRKLFVVLVFLTLFIFSGNAFALRSLYDNKGGYKNKGGYNNQIGYKQIPYNNQIPYKEFFDVSEQPELKKVQKYSKTGKVVQAVVPVNEKEEQVGQKGLEK